MNVKQQLHFQTISYAVLYTSSLLGFSYNHTGIWGFEEVKLYTRKKLTVMVFQTKNAANANFFKTPYANKKSVSCRKRFCNIKKSENYW
jgi:hypothetical protein